MRRFLLSAVMLLAPSSTLAGQPASVPRSSDVAAYRPVGEKRVWTFISRDSTLGRLESVVDEETVIGSVEGVTLKEKLRLDFKKVGHELLIEREGDFSVSSLGHFLRERVTVTANGQTSRLEVERDGEKLEGVATRGGQKTEQTVTFRRDGNALDSYNVDQLELLLALRDITVGDTVDEEILVPQDMLLSRIKGEVRDFAYVRLYNQVYDSVFVIVMTQPQSADLFLTKDKRLLKVNFHNEDMRAYLDVVRKPPSLPPTPPATAVDIISSVPLYLIFLAFGIFAMAFFISRGYRWSVSYVSFLVGAGLWAIAVFTELPAQNYLIRNLIVPAVQQRESLFLLGLLPALAVGVIQELLKLLAIFAVARVGKARRGRLLVIGSLCGAGFGILEACYLITGVDPAMITSWSFLERASLIVYHTASGVVLGYGLSGDTKRTIAAFGSLVAANAVLRYLPVLIQQQVAPLTVIYLTTALIALLVLAGAVLCKRSQRRADFT